MKKLLNVIHDCIIALGCARGAAELNRLGKHEEAQKLLNRCYKNDT